MLAASWVDEHAGEFDIMHVHFGFDAISPEDLTDVVRTLREHEKPLVLTVHDLRNPHHETADTHDAQLGVLVGAADAVLTLTPGAARTILARWGRQATVLPHPHVVPEKWLARPRPARETFVIGLHAKSLRANMDPLPLVEAIVAALPAMPGAVLRIDAHTDVMTSGYARHDAEFADRLTFLAEAGRLDLRVHDYFSDDELWGYLQELDVSVLPYRFGTHSGWLEACHDLGTWVVAPDCGFYPQQRPCLTYAATGMQRNGTLVEAVMKAHRLWRAGQAAPRAARAQRRAERDFLGDAHRAIYSELLERSQTCTS